jgi:glycosyltransferase involved in cell wall biosynthesis
MVHKKRAVLMILDSVFPKLGGGGAESQVRTLGQHLQARRIDVRIVVPMVSYGPQLAEDRVDGLKVVRIPYPRIRIVGGAIMLARLVVVLIRGRPEYGVIHAHIGHNMAAVCCLVGRLLQRPVIVKFTGMREIVDGVLAPRPGIGSMIRKVALRQATYYQATSNQIQRLLGDRGFDSSKVRLIPNAVDTQRFFRSGNTSEDRRDLCGEARLVGVFTGRLAPEKGLAQFLSCWSRVFKPSNHALLMIVGDGPLNQSLRELARRLGIKSQVVFVGHSDQVERYLAVADFGILPSLNEGLSNTLLEYMASGLPVIGSRISGTEDLVVHGKTGWLFTAGNEFEIEHCLSVVAALPLTAIGAMGRVARQQIKEYASIDAVVGQLMRLYGMVAPA